MFVSESVISSTLGSHPKISNGRVDDTAVSESVCLKAGCGVLLVYNEDVEDCFANGQLGVNVKIITSTLLRWIAI